MKKCLRILSILIVTLVFSTSVFAAEANKDDVTLSVVSREECTINFARYGVFEKKLLDIDEENKTIDITLTVKNTFDGTPSSHEETVDDVLPGEVVFLIDNSLSMRTGTEYVNNAPVSRLGLVLNAAKNLTNKLFTLNSDIKVGIASFSSVASPVTYGSDADARKVLDLSNNKDTVLQKIDTVSQNTDGSLTNFEAGAKVASTMFSNDTTKTKYLIVLSDAIPTLSIGREPMISPATTQATINKFAELQNSGINIVAVLSESDWYDIDGDPVMPSPSTYNPPISYPEISEEVFGDTSNPRFGAVYYAMGSNITDSIVNKIYEKLHSTKTITVEDVETYSLTDVVIKDYFPQNIVDNFNFEKLSEPQIGTVSDDIDKTDRSITWNIPKLEPKQSSSFTYRLSLKDKFNSEIIDLELPTNEKVVINYNEDGEPGDPVETTKTPSVILKMKTTPDIPDVPDDPDDPGKPDDPTVAPDPIPKTGSYAWMAVGISTAFGLSVAIYGAIKSYLVTK